VRPCHFRGERTIRRYIVTIASLGVRSPFPLVKEIAECFCLNARFVLDVWLV
jgi:hypothetical protein